MGCGCSERREAISRAVTAIVSRLAPAPMSISATTNEGEKIDKPSSGPGSALRDLLRKGKR